MRFPLRVRHHRSDPHPLRSVDQRSRKQRRRAARNPSRWTAVAAVTALVFAVWFGAAALTGGGGSTYLSDASSRTHRHMWSHRHTPSTPTPTPTPSATPSPSSTPAPTPTPTDPAPPAVVIEPVADTGPVAGGDVSGEAPSVSGQLFAADSPWNTTIASDAGYSADGASLTTAIAGRTEWATINSTVWSVPVAIAADGDPVVQVAIGSGVTDAHRMPASAAPSNDTDGELAVIDGTRSFEYWGLAGSNAGGWSARFGAVVDLTGSGMTGGVRASGFSLLGGLLRTSDMQGGINHALVVALAADQLRSGPVWPAQSEDWDSASSYRGAVPMGSLVAIPRSVDLASLNLSPSALALAQALQNYGAYVGDRSSAFTLYAEPAAEGPELAEMRAALATLVPLLHVVGG